MLLWNIIKFSFSKNSRKFLFSCFFKWVIRKWSVFLSWPYMTHVYFVINSHKMFIRHSCDFSTTPQRGLRASKRSFVYREMNDAYVATVVPVKCQYTKRVVHLREIYVRPTSTWRIYWNLRSGNCDVRVSAIMTFVRTWH